MNLHIDLQVATEQCDLPSVSDIELWVSESLQKSEQSKGDIPTEISVRIVDSVESQELNCQYRNKDKPTNVLSFPADLPEGIGLSLLGDLVICAPVVATEAKEQSKALQAHWAHMVVHGTLHLQGFDHQDDDEAENMEALETSILLRMGFPAPYANEEM